MIPQIYSPSSSYYTELTTVPVLADGLLLGFCAVWWIFSDVLEHYTVLIFSVSANGSGGS